MTGAAWSRRLSGSVLKRKSKTGRAGKTNLSDMIRGCVWPWGERQELAFWGEVAALCPTAAIALCPVLCTIWYVSVPSSWVHVFVHEGGYAEKHIHWHLCSRRSIDWDQCHAAKLLPLVSGLLMALFFFVMRIVLGS